ncbi:hypothetical protein V1282_004207 [Nitrobacteraceae bacterium AZCC 2146]
MMNSFPKIFVAGLLFCTPLVTGTPAGAEDFTGNDLREIRIGMVANDLSKTDYAGLACAAAPAQKLANWESAKDCPAGDAGLRAVRFAYDPASNPEGTMVAGHPAILTALIDNAGRVAGLLIETDPKTRLYLRKKAFLLGVQAKFRYGAEGWTCSEAQPGTDETSVGGVYLKEQCSKTVGGRHVAVERKLFRRANQDIKSFVDETRISILRAKG